ncbi:MAG TPA: glycosyltransferase, partial [Solirubrobacteraceae bacterium]|nr:glycosyltransferase [Solirubrobacteraceae bacterium]
MQQRLLVVSPVHNEAPHIERVARALAAQQRPPDAWIVVDDASTDDTYERLRQLAPRPPFLTLLRAPKAPAGKDALALANEIRAFSHGLAWVEREDGLAGPGGAESIAGGGRIAGGLDSFTHIAKLDGDVELPPEWYATLLERFAADPRLGIACGQLEEGAEGARGIIPIPGHHVHGAVKLYSRACLRAIGGLQPRLGWDTIDETYARMHGFSTCSFADPVAIHHRPFATRDGVLRGRARH